MLPAVSSSQWGPYLMFLVMAHRQSAQQLRHCLAQVLDIPGCRQTSLQSPQWQRMARSGRQERWTFSVLSTSRCASGLKALVLWCPPCPCTFKHGLPQPHDVHPAEFVDPVVQLTVVEEVSRGELLLQVGQMAVLVMRDFQVWRQDRLCYYMLLKPCLCTMHTCSRCVQQAPVT